MMFKLTKVAQFKPKPLAQIETKYFLFQIKVAQFEAKSLAQFDRNAWRKSNRSIQEVRLPKKLITSYNKEIPFKQEMFGPAEIVTENLRLLEWFFYQFKEVFSRE